MNRILIAGLAGLTILACSGRARASGTTYHATTSNPLPGDQRACWAAGATTYSYQPNPCQYGPVCWVPCEGGGYRPVSHCEMYCLNGGPVCSCCSHKVKDLQWWHPLRPLVVHQMKKNKAGTLRPAAPHGGHVGPSGGHDVMLPFAGNGQ